MQLKLLDLNDPKIDYDFNLSAINKHTWECFVFDVVLCSSKNINNVVQICSSVTIRDNQAKMMVGYQDDKYNELNLTLSPMKTFLGKHATEISEAWQATVASVYGKEYLDAVKDQDNLSQD